MSTINKEKLKEEINKFKDEIDNSLSKIIKDLEMAKEDINYFSNDTLDEIENLKMLIVMKTSFGVILKMLEED